MNTTQVNEKQPENTSTAPVILGTNPEHSRGSKRWLIDGVLPRVGLVVVRGRASSKKRQVAEDLAGAIQDSETLGARERVWGGRVIHRGKLLNLAAMPSFAVDTPDAIEKAERVARDFQCCVLVVDSSDAPLGNEALRNAAEVVLYVTPISRISGRGVVSVTKSPKLVDCDSNFTYATEIIEITEGDGYEIVSGVVEVTRNLELPRQEATA